MKNISTPNRQTGRVWLSILILVIGFGLSWWFYTSIRDYFPPITLLLGGIIISLLLAALCFSLTNPSPSSQGEQKSRWQLALEGGHIGVWDLDVTSEKAFYSKEWKQMLGYSEDEIKSKHEEWLKRLHPDDKEKTVKMLERYINRLEDQYQLECRIKCKDGSYKWILSSGTATERDQEGRATRIIGTHIDITKRKNAQFEIQKLAMITSLTKNGIIITDKNGKTTWINEAFSTITGYTISEVKGKKPGEFLQGPQTNLETISLMHEHLLRGEGFNVEVQNYTKNHSPIWLQLEVQPIFDDNGKLIHYMGIEIDVTEKKQIETMRNEFVSMVSHELRTPLASIRGSIGLVSKHEEKNISHKSHMLLQIALSNCERLVRLISDILDVDKMEAGLLDFRMEKMDLSEVIKTALSNNQGFAEKFSLKLVGVGLDQPCPLMGDRDRLLQVMDNLISNGCKYSPENSELTIRMLLHDNDVRVEVEDHGPGIPKEQQNVVFEKFMQVDSSDRREKGGSGLGLYLSKIIVKKHGGNIGFDTTLGKGTCFYFELPLS